jgi:hypothetical protein
MKLTIKESLKDSPKEKLNNLLLITKWHKRRRPKEKLKRKLRLMLLPRKKRKKLKLSQRLRLPRSLKEL